MTARTGPRHLRPAERPEVEPVHWLASSISRGWRWVWATDHDDPATTAAAWLVRFGLLVTFFLAMVAGSG